MVFQPSPRMPSNQKPAKFRRIEEKKVAPKNRSPAIATGQPSRKQLLKVGKPDSFGQSSLKTKRMQGDIICIESDEENTDVKRSHRFQGNQQSTVESMVDDKTVALQAIVAQALNEARAVRSGCDDNFHIGGLYAVKSEGGGGGRSEFMPMKAEPVSSSQSMEPYDIGEDDGGAQCQRDFDGGLNVKPVFDEDQLRNPWEMGMGGGQKQSDSSLAYSRPTSRNRHSARPMESMQWIKTEEEQHGRGMMPKSSTPGGRVPFYQATDPGRTFSSPPQQLWGQSGLNMANSGVEAADDHSQEASGNWKSFATGDFICNIDSCGKEFATKRLMLHHQKAVHGTASEDGGGETADASAKEAFHCDIADD